MPPIHAPAYGQTLWLHGLPDLARAAWGVILAWRRRRRTMVALHNLPDRTLADIGIARDEIAAIAHSRVRRGGSP